MATLNSGSGADGNAVVSANTNLNTASLIGRGYGDMIAYSCSSVGSNSCVATAAPNGIVAGDEVLLISLQGTQTNYANVGNYETFIVDSINTNTITFTTSKSNNYGDDGGDTNIGVTTSNQRVMVQRVPQYANLTIDNGFAINPSSFVSTIGGVLFIRASGTVLINGSITTLARGYRGGVSSAVEPGYPGESIAGIGPNVQSTDNHGGGCGWYGNSPYNGAGGGYGTAGYPGHSNAPGGTVYGEQTLQKLFMGAGGGAGPFSNSGGEGSGVIAVFATTVDIYGTIMADGYVGKWRPSGFVGDERWMSGCGAGASVLIHAGTIYTRSSTFTAIGGQLGDPGDQPTYHAGGGDGRIAISYASLGDNISAIDPVPYTDDTLELPYSISGTASGNCTIRIYDGSWVFVKSQAVSTGAYEISNLPNAGPFNLVAEPDAISSNNITYRDVVPAQ
jgi:hypothetical protein